jgi:SAM-dependent methyltransferase
MDDRLLPLPRAAVSVELETVVCNVCGSARSETYLLQEDRRFPDTPRHVFRLVKCIDCGLIYLNPRPVTRDISLFYPQRFYSDRPPTALPRGPLAAVVERFSMARHFARSALEEKQRILVDALPGPGRLLDVGCAAGEFLLAMRGRGWTVVGLDISPEMCDDVRRRLQIECWNGSINELQLEPGSFDAITFWASMEHVYDPRAALGACHRALRPNGVVVILVPNARSLEETWLGSLDPNPVDIPRHLYHFTEHTLGRLLRDTGFVPVTKRHHTRNAADRLTVVLANLVDRSLAGHGVFTKALRLLAHNCALVMGDLLSRLLAVWGRSHTFIFAAKRTAPNNADQHHAA